MQRHDPRDRRTGPTPYKASFTVVAESGARSRLYDAGDCSPYSIESLLDTLRGKARGRCRSVELTLEIGAPCSATMLAELRRRFRTVTDRDIRVHIVGGGRAPRGPVTGH